MSPNLIASLMAIAIGADRPDGLYVRNYEAYRSAVRTFEIRQSGGDWQALVNGEPRSIALNQDGSLRIKLANGEAFRGQRDGADIRGYWERPSHEYGGQDFSTPLTLRSSGSNTWSGEPQVLEEDFLIFHYFGQEDGEPYVAVRNPERNAIGAAYRYQWTQNDDGTGQFFVGDGEGRWSRSLSYDPNKDEVVSGWAWSADSSLLRRPTDAEAARFGARVGAVSDLSPVPELPDGWKVSSLGNAGIDPEPLKQLVQNIAAVKPAALRPDLIHSLLVSHKGALVMEEYFYGHDRNDTHDLRSAGKTYASLLAGALIQGGLDLNPDTLVMPVLRKHIPNLPVDERREAITFGNLLSHQSGLACGNGRGGAPPGNEETLWAQRGDFWAFTASLPMVSIPGTRYHYCSGNINLAAGVLAFLTGQNLFELIDTQIMRPLDIHLYHWNVTHNGRAYFGGGAQLRPRDFLKMGQVALDNGKWRGRQILDPNWLAASIKKAVEITPETTGTTEEAFANDYILSADGLGWHLIELKSQDQSYETYYASGNGGQLVFVVPELELVVGMTGGQYRWGSIWNSWPKRFIGGHIIPAITGQSSGNPIR